MKKQLYILLLIMGCIITSCKTESLQSYLVESQNKPEFSHFSIPSSILKLSKSTISVEEEKAYNSIQKINITGLLTTNAAVGQYETEKNKLKSILKNSDYKTLMNVKNKGYNATLYYKGNTNAIDEIIAFGYGTDLGVGIARILGNNINPNTIIKMLQKTTLDVNDTNLTQLKSLFK